MELVQTQKGKAAIHLEGFKYVKHRTNSNASTVWRCARYWSLACKASLITRGSELIARNGFHIHEPNANEVHVDRERERLRMKWLQQRPAGKSPSERRELQKKGGGVSSWKHFKRMEALLGSRGSMRDLEDSQDAPGEEGAEDEGMELTKVLVPGVSTYVESQSEYIVPTTSDPSAPSTSNTAADAPSSLLLCDVRSLATGAPTSEAGSLSPVRIKEEREETMEEESFEQHVASCSPPAATTFSAPLQASTMAAAPIETPVLRTIGPAVVLPPVVDSSILCAANQAPATDATQCDAQEQSQQATNPSGNSACTGTFVRGRKRPATPWTMPSINERKARIEIEILLAQRRKLESELKKAEADERKAVAEAHLLTEELKKCEEEKKKLKAEAEFFVQEKKRSEEETRKAAAIADYHIEEKKKTAAKTDMLIEHKMFYIEQQKTEIVRRRMLLLEMKKMKQDLKLVQ